MLVPLLIHLQFTRSNKSTFNVGLVSVKYSLNWYFLWSRFFLAPHSALMFACRYNLIMVYRSHTARALIGKAVFYQSLKYTKSVFECFLHHYLYIIKEMKKPKPCITL